MFGVSPCLPFYEHGSHSFWPYSIWSPQTLPAVTLVVPLRVQFVGRRITQLLLEAIPCGLRTGNDFSVWITVIRRRWIFLGSCRSPMDWFEVYLVTNWLVPQAGDLRENCIYTCYLMKLRSFLTDIHTGSLWDAYCWPKWGTIWRPPIAYCLAAQCPMKQINPPLSLPSSTSTAYSRQAMVNIVVDGFRMSWGIVVPPARPRWRKVYDCIYYELTGCVLRSNYSQPLTYTAWYLAHPVFSPTGIWQTWFIHYTCLRRDQTFVSSKILSCTNQLTVLNWRCQLLVHPETNGAEWAFEQDCQCPVPPISCLVRHK